MAFQLVYLSQQDPQWKNDTLGFGNKNDTIGHVGCALTSVAMLLSGHGYPETPKTLNKKLKDKQGFVSAGIRWDVVNQVHPQVKLKANINCETTNAPLDRIEAALEAGQPVVVRVDASPNPGLQWHYVLLYARKGDDYLMLDPWPYQPGTAKEDLLLKRYSQSKPLKRAIQQVLLYEAPGSGGAIPTPPSTEDTTPAPTPADGVYARVMDSVTWGLNIRSSTDTSSPVNVIASVPAGTQLLLLKPDEASKIGNPGQWVRVRAPGGREGFAAAWYLEKVPGAVPAPPLPEPEPAPTSTPGGETPSPETPPSAPSTPTAPPDPEKFTLVVSEAVGTSGLRLRKTPSMGGTLVMVLNAGTALTVLEPAAKARSKVGKVNKWIHVREPGGKRGYVAAAYVRLP